MVSALLITVLCQAMSPMPAGGTIVDARSGRGIAGAQVSVVGGPVATRSDRDGRFRWTLPPPPPPVTIIVVLPDGRVARPIRLADWPASGDLALAADAAVAEGVTVSGVAPTIDIAPGASTTFLPRVDLALRTPATLPQALENVAGVSFISEGQGAVPTIRGLARGRSLILVDGARVSTERRAGPNASFLDPADVDSIEVARGPGSVAYGSDAFGGVIAVRTRRAAFEMPLQVRVSGTFGGGVPERRGDVELSRGFGSDAVLVSIRARALDDYHAPDGVVPNSGWRDGGVALRWDHDAGPRAWSIGWQSGLAREIGRPRSDTAVMAARSPYEDSHRLTVSFKTLTAGWFRNVRIDGLFGYARERTTQDRIPTAKQPRNVSQADTSFEDTQLRISGDRIAGPVLLTLGADVQGRYGLTADDTTIAYALSGRIASIQANPSIASAHRTGVGIFGEASAQLARRIRISGGLRGDTVRNTNIAGYFGDRQVNNAAAAGLASATFVLTSRTTATAQIARGFRDPTLTDRFYRGPVGRGYIEGNPELRPETSRQVDVTARWDSSRVQLAAAFYDYRIANLVERYVVGGTNFFFRNRGAARLRGAEIEAHAALRDGFAVEMSSQISSGKDAGTGAPLDDIAPRAAIIVLRHRARTFLDSYLRAAAIARHAAAGPSEVPTPGFVAIDVGAAWHRSSRFTVRGVARNLLDQKWYSSAGPRWVYAPGRNGSLTFTIAF
jgi:outer membrane receptor protein involved in Fe transport